MIMRTAALAVLLLGSACAQQLPDSNPNSGVGFERYGDYVADRMQRDAELQRTQRSPVPEGLAIASETVAVLNTTRPIGGTTVQAPLSAVPAPQEYPSQVQTSAIATTSAPLAGASNSRISDEQNFDAVAGRESIESDAQRLARQRDAYQVIQPEALPTRSGSGGPNIVAFALSTSNRLGESVYRRTGRSSTTAFSRACARYGSADQAQEAFLKAGGPKSDRQGLDPDGDGFACFWDPTPFRAARGG